MVLPLLLIIKGLGNNIYIIFVVTLIVNIRWLFLLFSILAQSSSSNYTQPASRDYFAIVLAVLQGILLGGMLPIIGSVITSRKSAVIKHLGDPNFRILTRDDDIIIGHKWEYAYLIDLCKRKEVYLGDFYGDPQCALISEDKGWCIVGEDHVVVWHKDKGVIPLDGKELRFVVSVCQSGSDTVELLVNGDNEDSLSLWKLCISDFNYFKIADIARS
jgi:hypothetical protein